MDLREIGEVTTDDFKQLGWDDGQVGTLMRKERKSPFKRTSSISYDEFKRELSGE